MYSYMAIAMTYIAQLLTCGRKDTKAASSDILTIKLKLSASESFIKIFVRISN